MNDIKLTSILDEYHVPHHISVHMEKVALVALFIAKKLVDRGVEVNIENLKYACLLHDLVKTCEIKDLDKLYATTGGQRSDLETWKSLVQKYSSIGHIEAAYQILSKMGEKEIAGIILKHRFESVTDPKATERPSTWEEKLLYYADKRVMHDKIVTILKRLEDGRKRYFPDGNVPSGEKQIEKAILDLEEEICKAAGISPDDISVHNLADSV